MFKDNADGLDETLYANLKVCIPDVFYMQCFFSLSLQTNILSFLAELLYWFEISKPEFVQPLQDTELTGKYVLNLDEFLQYQSVKKGCAR